MRVEFAITADLSVGGIVEEVIAIEAPGLTSPALIECVRETMYTMSFPPPEGGGTVKVSYPFVFSNEAPQRDQEREPKNQL